MNPGVDNSLPAQEPWVIQQGIPLQRGGLHNDDYSRKCTTVIILMFPDVYNSEPPALLSTGAALGRLSVLNLLMLESGDVQTPLGTLFPEQQEPSTPRVYPHGEHLLVPQE